MLPATPQRTADSRSLDPTPMIALEMTWVVETGIPKCDAVRMIVAAVVSAAKPWTGSSFTTCWPIVRMIRQPPAAVPSEIAVAARTMTHSGIVDVGRQDAGRDQGQGHDPHRLLGVVRAVAERHEGGRHDLQPPEPSFIRRGLARRKTLRITTMSRKPIDDARGSATGRAARAPCRRRRRRLIADAPTDDDHGPEQAADQGVARRARDAEPPGDAGSR